MDFVTKIKDAIVPNADTFQPPEGSPMNAEDSIPGAFPDADEEPSRGHAAEEQNASSAGHTQQGLGSNVGHSSTSQSDSLAQKQPALGSAAERTDRVVPVQTGAPRDIGNDSSTTAQTPGTVAESPSYPRDVEHAEGADSAKLQSQTGSAHHTPNPLSRDAVPGNTPDFDADSTTTTVKPRHLGNEGKAETPDTFNSASQGVQRTTEEIKPQHLGNEGKPEISDLSGTAPHGAQRTTEEIKPQHLGNEGKPDIPSASNTSEWTTEEVKPRHLGNEGKIPGAGAQEDLSTTTGRDLETHVPETGSDPSLDAARRQAQGTQGKFGIPVEPRQDDSQGRVPGDPSVGAAADQLKANAVSAAYASGGIHNGVLGAGSDDPLGEGAEGIHERHSHHQKGESHSTLPRVSESGLGQGGVHNGVVGHGSTDDEERRRSTSDGASEQAVRAE